MLCMCESTQITACWRGAHLLESGVWISSMSSRRPAASSPSSYLVSTSSRPLLKASACPAAKRRSASSAACTQRWASVTPDMASRSQDL